MFKRNNGFINELFAFHKLEVNSDKLEEIFENNLDKEFTNQNHKGIVFEINPLLNDKGVIFYCKILVGFSTKECSTKLPPDRIKNIRFDSTTDESENKICIFDKNQILPLYLFFTELLD